jgi:hypothetical protein
VSVTGETTAFANAMIFDGVSAELREGCVRVAAGAIVEVGEAPEAGDRVIDCRGRMGTQRGLPRRGAPFRREPFGINRR